MKRYIPGFVAGILFTAILAVPAAARVRPVIVNLPCGGVIVTEVEEIGGCVVKQWGIRCDGTFWETNFSIRTVSQDPGGMYDMYIDDTDSLGRAWYLKSTYDHVTGVATATWGSCAGNYYVTEKQQ